MVDSVQIATKDDAVSKLPITEKDKENFYKSVLADAKYEDTISMFGGMHKLTFRALTVEENEDVLKQFKLDEKNGVSATDSAYFVQLVSYRLGVSLLKIDGEAFQPEVIKDKVTATDKETYVAVRAALFKKWSAFKLSAYIDVFNQFEDKIARLGKEIQTESFWTASE